MGLSSMANVKYAISTLPSLFLNLNLLGYFTLNFITNKYIFVFKDNKRFLLALGHLEVSGPFLEAMA